MGTCGSTPVGGGASELISISLSAAAYLLLELPKAASDGRRHRLQW